MVEDPSASALAKPLEFEPLVLFIVAILVLAEYQLAVGVRLLVLPSLYEPVAVNWTDPPTETDGEGGVTAMESNAGIPVPERFTF